MKSTVVRTGRGEARGCSAGWKHFVWGQASGRARHRHGSEGELGWMVLVVPLEQGVSWQSPARFVQVREGEQDTRLAVTSTR